MQNESMSVRDFAYKEKRKLYQYDSAIINTIIFDDLAAAKARGFTKRLEIGQSRHSAPRLQH